jgi:hypothetical protein
VDVSVDRMWHVVQLCLQSARCVSGMVTFLDDSLKNGDTPVIGPNIASTVACGWLLAVRFPWH